MCIRDSLYRIAQEALYNSIQHSGARQVRVDLCVDTDIVRLTVLDDGQGLPVDGPARIGLGFKTMRDMAAAIGGRFSIGVPTGGGTSVTVECENRESGALSRSKAW